MEGNLRDSKRADFSLHEKCLSIIVIEVKFIGVV